MRPGVRDGFTVVELLVVVTVIVFLAAMLAPALDGALESAMRVRCASNLRVIHGASHQYARENRGTFFISRFRAAPHGINAIHPNNHDNANGGENRSQPGDSSVNWTEAIHGVGLTVGPTRTAGDAQYRNPAPVWDCPSSLQPKSYFNGNYFTLQLQYQYFGGHDRWYNASDGNRESRSPVQLTSSDPHWVLVTDFTMKVQGAWKANHLAPAPAQYPAGGNQAWVDGSVEWKEFDSMAFISGWHIGTPVMYGQNDVGPGGLAEFSRARYFR